MTNLPKRAVNALHIEKPNAARRKKDKSFLDGHSRAIQNVSRLIEHVACTNTTVLIHGESGTGKELVARSIHSASDRASGPFIPVNCASIQEELLDSILFGNEHEIFSTEDADKKGYFELAENGTLFLDEISNMSLSIQAKFLRVLEEKGYEKNGSTHLIKSNVRVVAATHEDLAQLVSNGQFRKDLYFRLNVFPIELPPLRRRAEDIPALVFAITEKLKIERNAHLTLNNDALKMLGTYHWPGNVRELSNLIERFSILYPDRVIDNAILSHDLAPDYNQKDDRISELITNKPFLEQQTAADFIPELPKEGINLKEHMAILEVYYIREALERSNGVVARAAKLLGLQRTTLVEKIRKFNIQR